MHCSPCLEVSSPNELSCCFSPLSTSEILVWLLEHDDCLPCDCRLPVYFHPRVLMFLRYRYHTILLRECCGYHHSERFLELSRSVFLLHSVLCSKSCNGASFSLKKKSKHINGRAYSVVQLGTPQGVRGILDRDTQPCKATDIGHSYDRRALKIRLPQNLQTQSPRLLNEFIFMNSAQRECAPPPRFDKLALREFVTS